MTKNNNEGSNPQSEVIEIDEKVLQDNNKAASFNRDLFQERGVTALNLLGSPGAGKTSLLEVTLKHLKEMAKTGVLVGDLETDNDIERLEGLVEHTFSLNTHGACHLDARGITKNIEKFPVDSIDLFFIENVGNLVCPASFDLGEDFRVIVLSTTEGTDKPAKYPPMFNSADVVIINKIDLLPYVDFDVQEAKKLARNVNPQVEIFEVSCKNGEGIDDWFSWLDNNALGS